MAQTTGASSGITAQCELSADGTTWTDISGSVTAIEPSEATKMSGEAYTLEGDKAILGGGKQEPQEITVRFLYTKTTGEAFEVARAIYETPKSECYLRWSPHGNVAGAQLFTSDKGVMTSFLYPKAAADDAAPIPGAFTVRTPGVTTTTIATP